MHARRVVLELEVLELLQLCELDHALVASARLARKAPIICCELHSPEAAREVLDVLVPRGYRVSRLDGTPFVIGRAVPGEVHVMAIPPGHNS